MDYSYFGAPQVQQYGFMGMQPYTQSTEDPTLKFAGNEQIDPTYLPPSYDAFHYSQIPHTGASPPSALDASHSAIASMEPSLDMVDEYTRQNSLTRASSEENLEKETLTPAQSRRKAQNRAAQRAFRERKEKHVKDLETRLHDLESSATTLQSDNERLKQALRRMTTENEMLRGVTSTSNSRPTSLSLAPGSKDDAYSIGTIPHTEKGAMLDAAGAWDLIQSHKLVKSGLVDLADVFERLKGVATCDGQGPVYEEGLVWRAVEESNRGGGDELI